ncbi:MAG TPA: response regulator [Caulobacterales bacterium]|nr:response regulator [Caulobacterales bacterium]
MPNQRDAEQRRRALVVDDHPTNRKLMQAIVEEMGWRCVAAESGADALAACRGGDRFDLILMDYRMPGMDGCETTIAIRALGGWAAHVPVIGITAEDSRAARGKCLAAGMLVCISKPIQPLAITALMRRALAPRQPDAPLKRLAVG